MVGVEPGGVLVGVALMAAVRPDKTVLRILAGAHFGELCRGRINRFAVSGGILGESELIVLRSIRPPQSRRMRAAMTSSE